MSAVVRRRRTTVLCRVSAAVTIVLASLAMPAHAGQLDILSWLAGCWASPDNEEGSGEFWQPLAGRTMIGVARTIRGGKTIEYEFLRLHEDEDGRAIYTATPSGQRDTSFLAVQVDAGAATFENSAHDFPQRIIYVHTDQQHMLVRIEGQHGNTFRVVEFKFERVACPK